MLPIFDMTEEELQALVDHHETEEQQSDTSIEWDEEDFSVLGRYWSPVNYNDFGAHGIAEMQIASANYFNEGDIGNDAWRSPRELPFGDFDSELIGIGYNALLLYGYEDHPERAPRARTVPEWQQGDTTLKWAMDSYIECQEKLLGAEDPTETMLLEGQMAEYAEFVADMRSYKERITEDAMFAVPDYYIDVLHHAMEYGLMYDPKIVPEAGVISALKSEPVSVSKFPSMKEVQTFHNVYEDYEINGLREWCPAIVDGEQTFGPYGHKVAKIKLLKAAGFEDGREIADHREVVLAQMLSDHGLSLNMEGQWEHTADATLELLTETYANLAEEISAISNISSSILEHRKMLIEGLRKEAMIELLKEGSAEISDNIANLLNKRALASEDTLPSDWEKDVYSMNDIFQRINGKHMAFHSWKQVTQVYKMINSDELIAQATIDLLAERIYKKVETSTYILQVKSLWGWETLAVTKDEDLAVAFRSSKAQDIPFFQAGKKARNQFPSYSIVLETEGEMAAEMALVNWLKYSKATSESLQALARQHNAGHRVKTINSRANRLTGWLFGQMVLTTSQLQEARRALAVLGNKVVNTRCREFGVFDKLAFRRLQLVMLVQLRGFTQGKTSKFNKAILEKIANGQVDLHFNWGLIKFKNEAQRKLMIKNGWASGAEQEAFVKPIISFNKTIINQAETFQIARNFKPNQDIQDLAQQHLDNWT